ncbi:MAG: hydroxyacylglutathione hydrolase [Hyphomicrobiaceae bacterium]|nr:hydroxyacylglutathione hydrolase [Hyphomicrobiaceae bacterium]
MTQAPLDWRLIPCLDDNYAVLLRDEATGTVALVDAPEEAPILKAVEETGWVPSLILITHHHHDHVGALDALKMAFGATATGPEAEAARIKGLDTTVGEGDRLMLGETALDVIATPGHTRGHIAYAGGGVLMAGDTLFALGCGRLFEDTPQAMWASLQKLRALPDDTLLFCGHEYTASNARYALHVDDGNDALVAYAGEIATKRARAEPTIPAPLGREKETNPFLRADEAVIARAMGLEPGTDPAQVFAALRKGKDTFR